MASEGVYKMPLPGGGVADLFDPTGGVSLERRRQFAETADSLSGDQPILELHDVILCHRHEHACLYDRDGRRIEASALVRYEGDGSRHLYKAAPDLPDLATPYVIEEPVIYGGVFFNHWGHFLLETFTRLSVARAQPELARWPAVFSQRLGRERRLPTITQFLDLADAPHPDSTHHAQVRLRTCILPPPAFVSLGFAQPRHREVIEQVARRFAFPSPPEPRPVYFSRSRLAARSQGNATTINEPEFEVRLAQKGVDIVHTQELSLAEQIRLVNSRRTIIGLWGSALHNILFALDGSKLTTYILIKTRQLAGNYLLVDSLVGNRSHYLATLETLPSGEQKIDIEATLKYLAGAGALQ